MPKPKLYSTSEAAEYCGISLANMKFYLRKGRITPDYRLPGALAFRETTLRAFMDSPKRSAGRPPEDTAKPQSVARRGKRRKQTETETPIE